MPSVGRRRAGAFFIRRRTIGPSHFGRPSETLRLDRANVQALRRVQLESGGYVGVTKRRESLELKGNLGKALHSFRAENLPRFHVVGTGQIEKPLPLFRLG